MLDNNMSDKKIDDVNIKKVVNAPIFPNLGIDFSNNTNHFQWNHFKFSGSIDCFQYRKKHILYLFYILEVLCSVINRCYNSGVALTSGVIFRRKEVKS